MVKVDMNIFVSSGGFSAADESVGPLDKFADRLPGVRKSADQVELNRRNRARESIKSIIKHLGVHPDEAGDVWLDIQARHSGASGKSSTGGEGLSAGEYFDHGRSTWGRIPTQFLASWMSSVAGGPAQQLLDRIDAVDADALRDMFTRMTQLRRGDPVPKQCMSLPVCRIFLNERMAQVGPRIAGWFATSVQADGRIDWSKAPLYTMAWGGNGTLTKVTHISGATAEIPEHVTITRDWAFVDAHDDQAAKFYKPPVTHLVHTFFGAQDGPNQFIVDRKGKVIASMAARAEDKIKQSQKEFEELTCASPSDVLKSRANMKRKAALDQAKASFAKRSAKPARTVSCLDLEG